jgi:hypothetical protein
MYYNIFVSVKDETIISFIKVEHKDLSKEMMLKNFLSLMLLNFNRKSLTLFFFLCVGKKKEVSFIPCDISVKLSSEVTNRLDH